MTQSPDRDAMRAKCDAHRARHRCKPATSSFACSICPATLICDVPLKKRAVLFGAAGEQPTP